MNQNQRRMDAAAIIGLSLVLIGGWLLAHRLLGPLLIPFNAIVAAIGSLVWPLLLVAIGALLIMRGRANSATNGAPVSGRRLYRSRTERVITGVIAGAADYLGVSATALRVIYTVLTIMTGVWAGVLIYAVASVLVAEQPFGEVVPAPPVPGAPVPAAPPVPPAPAVPQN
jgi:phage shock protein C